MAEHLEIRVRALSVLVEDIVEKVAAAFGALCDALDAGDLDENGRDE